MQKETETTSVKLRAEAALKDERLPWNRSAAAGDDGDEGGGSWDGFDD
jgi:hypothetical protein